MPPSQVLVRGLPDHVRSWIDEERYRRKMSKNELLLAILEDATEYRKTSSPLRSARIPFGEAKSADNGAGHGTARPPFTFIDLFAGIGGFRLGLERVGGRCVFTSEWDKYAQKTYSAWFGDTPHGDITKIKTTDIPDHDIMAAGFPCQPFSIAGVSKKKSLGRQHGFKDVTQGTLFFHLASIAEIKRPPVMMLENVKNLLSHDQGRTWAVIQETLESLDYAVFHKIIDAQDTLVQDSLLPY